MPIVEPVIRPLAKAESFLLQVTLGCSANSCSFCGAYKSKTFHVKSQDELAELYKHKLSLIYMGLESGSQGVLDRGG